MPEYYLPTPSGEISNNSHEIKLPIVSGQRIEEALRILNNQKLRPVAVRFPLSSPNGEADQIQLYSPDSHRLFTKQNFGIQSSENDFKQTYSHASDIAQMLTKYQENEKNNGDISNVEGILLFQIMQTAELSKNHSLSNSDYSACDQIIKELSQESTKYYTNIENGETILYFPYGKNYIANGIKYTIRKIIKFNTGVSDNIFFHNSQEREAIVRTALLLPTLPQVEKVLNYNQNHTLTLQIVQQENKQLVKITDPKGVQNQVDISLNDNFSLSKNIWNNDKEEINLNDNPGFDLLLKLAHLQFQPNRLKATPEQMLTALSYLKVLNSPSKFLYQQIVSEAKELIESALLPDSLQKALLPHIAYKALHQNTNKRISLYASEQIRIALNAIDSLTVDNESTNLSDATDQLNQILSLRDRISNLQSISLYKRIKIFLASTQQFSIPQNTLKITEQINTIKEVLDIQAVIDKRIFPASIIDPNFAIVEFLQQNHISQADAKKFGVVLDRHNQLINPYNPNVSKIIYAQNASRTIPFLWAQFNLAINTNNINMVMQVHEKLLEQFQYIRDVQNLFSTIQNPENLIFLQKDLFPIQAINIKTQNELEKFNPSLKQVISDSLGNNIQQALYIFSKLGLNPGNEEKPIDFFTKIAERNNLTSRQFLNLLHEIKIVSENSKKTITAEDIVDLISPPRTLQELYHRSNINWNLIFKYDINFDGLFLNRRTFPETFGMISALLRHVNSKNRNYIIRKIWDHIDKENPSKIISSSIESLKVSPNSIIDLPGVTIHLNKLIGSGGFGEVYEAETIEGELLAFKFISEFTTDTEDKLILLEKILDEGGIQKTDSYKVILPRQLVYDEQGKLLGYLMPLVPKEFSTFDKYYENLSKADLPFVLHVFNNLAQGLLELHNKGIVSGDLKLNNILVNPHTGEVDFIDIDSSQIISDVNHKIYTNFISNPELPLEEERFFQKTQQKDYLYLGIIISSFFKHVKVKVPDELEVLLKNSSSNDPAKRPTASEWVKTITQVIRNMLSTNMII